VQNGFPHTIYILLTLVLSLAHVYVSYDFAPSCFNVEFGKFLLVYGLLPKILLRPLSLFAFLLIIILLEETPALGLTGLFISPLSLLL
jgi:hypothetical protein